MARSGALDRMTWTYHQASGELRHDGALIAVGYSGRPPYRNVPEADARSCEGPIPKGRWRMVAVFDSRDHGPYCIRLTAYPDCATHGRDGFLVHGDSSTHPGYASQGCIIVGRKARESMWQSEDAELEVVA